MVGTWLGHGWDIELIFKNEYKARMYILRRDNCR